MVRCAEERRRFRREVGQIEPKRLVFVDETGVTTALTPAYGRAPRGQRVVGSAPASWGTVTVIAALGLDGVLRPAGIPRVDHTQQRSRRTWSRCWCRNSMRGT